MKALMISVRLRILFVMLQNVNSTPIRDDLIRYSESMGYFLDELDSFGGRCCCDWLDLYPLSELVDGDENVVEAARCCL